MRHARMSTDDKERRRGGRGRGKERKERERKRKRERECDEKRKVFPRKPRLEKKWLMRPDVRLLLAWIIAFPMTKQKLTPHFPKHRRSRQITSHSVDNWDKSGTSLAWATLPSPGQDSKSTKCFRLLFHANIAVFRSIPPWQKKRLLNRHTSEWSTLRGVACLARASLLWHLGNQMFKKLRCPGRDARTQQILRRHV